MVQTQKIVFQKRQDIQLRVLLNKAGTSDCNEADRVLSNLTELNLNWNKITDITPLSALTNLTISES